MAETRGGGGEGGERRQRATGIHDNRVDIRTTGNRGRRKGSHAKEGPVEGDGDFQAMAAAENGIEGEGCGRRCWAWTQGRRMRRGRQETGKEGAGGSASAAPRRKHRRRKRPRSMAAMAISEAGTGGLMKTEMRPTATEKEEGGEGEGTGGVGGGREGEEGGEAGADGEQR